jgi:hypothetical protein
VLDGLADHDELEEQRSYGESLVEHLVADAVLEHVGSWDIYGKVEDLTGVAPKRSQVESVRPG